MQRVHESARASRAAQSGVTLVEVLFAGFVLSVTAVALAATLVQGKRLADAPRDEISARNAIQAMFAEMAATPFPQIAPTFERAGFAVPGLEAPANDPDGLPGQILLDYGPSAESYYTVTLRVQWRSGNDVRTVESVRFISNVRGDTGAVPALTFEDRYAKGG